MKEFKVTKIITVSLLVTSSCEATSLFVDQPFLTQTARNNFSQCFPSVTAENLLRLKNIKKYGYIDFPPPTDCTTPGCRPALKEFTSTRVIEFDASQFNPATIKNSIYSLEGGDCSYNRILNYNSTLTKNRISYNFTPFHKERACNYGVIFDKGSAQADITVSIDLLPDFSIKTNTTKSNIKNDNNFSFGSIFADVLLGGILLGPTGIFIGAVAIPEISRSVLSNSDNFGGSKFDADLSSTGVNLYAYSNVQKKLDKLGLSTPLGPYLINREQSGFNIDNNNVTVQVIQSAQVLDIMRKDFIDARFFEIAFLSSLNEVDGKTYTVKKGDNLWNIVKNEYMDARLFILVAQANKLKKNQALLPGSILTLPRWHDMCRQLGGNPTAVLKGESLWMKANLGQIPKNLKKVKTYTGRKSLIYPLEILQVAPPL